jgi:hypothetical protein
MLRALLPVGNPAMTLVGRGRISELCLQSERGAEAYEQLRAALAELGELGDLAEWSDMVGVRWGLVLACLQRGEPDEAEHWLELAVPDRDQEWGDVFTPDLPVRAEIALARGLSELGLGLWRQAVEHLRKVRDQFTGDPFMDSWTLRVESAALAAHALCGRPEPVSGLAARLRERLLGMLSGAAAEDGNPVELPVYGTVLLAVGLDILASRDPAAGVRLVALTEHMPVIREFPSLSSAASRAAAEHADGAAYSDARSRYAALGREELRAEALRELTGAARG